MNKVKYILQWPDGDFICAPPLVSSPFAAFAIQHEGGESDHWLWLACGVRALRIEEGPCPPAKCEQKSFAA